ncbi:MAG: heat-inducible transcription repressor HrcA [Candidatus Dadabacteria bacterium RBG_19FT_COMBO_40_33]|jgi:heat-inducible transcriptional repressor|nr:MAG: heat-inducible transcription repressor HrcA [Candidatus Dadabacteria bacterium RBG_19FT_COMBO_40_33]
MNREELSERGKRILNLIVNHHIKTGEPIGSNALVKSYELPWSSATVRTTMADLMNEGYLSQPHVSAGRIPSEKGFRFYIDSLLYPQMLSEKKRGVIRRRYERIEGTLDEVMHETSKMLSDISRCAGLVMLPRARLMNIKSTELIKLGDKKVLFIIVFEGGLTEKTLIRMNREAPDDMLKMLSRYLNELAIGLTLDQLRVIVLDRLKSEKRLYHELVLNFLRFSREIYEQKIQTDIYIKGQTSILENSKWTPPERLRKLLKAFEEKSVLVDILDKAMKGEGTRVFVGSEIGIMEGYSLVTAPYGGGRKLGTLGVLGPIRMDYSKIIPLVDYTARVLSEIIAGGE